jgi:hypothetical protein
MTLTLVPKFVRAHEVNSSIAGTKSLPWFFKLMYEFWGFCLHGSVSITEPGGFPLSGVNMPVGFTTGSLMLTGSTGYTSAGEQFFRSDTTDFTSGGNVIVGKHLVTWVPGSTSSDDSIYLITHVVNSSTIRVNTFTGATPYSASLIPYFNTRTGISFRVIDFASLINGLTFASGNYMIMNLSGASLVNSGQLTPQFKVALTNTTDTFALSWSPSGSWNGSVFTDEQPVYTKQWRNSTSTGQGNFTLIAADDFMIGHYCARGTDGWDSSGQGSGFHIEVPQRLYPQKFDPNPVTATVWGRNTLNTTSTTENYGGGWFMHVPPAPTNPFTRWTTLVRSPIGEYFFGSGATLFGSDGNYGSFVSGRWNMIFFNPYLSKFFVSDVLLCQTSVLNQFSLSRVRLRRFKATAPIIPNFQRLGASGEWIHTTGGVIWPWDNAIVPSLMPSGL